VLLVALAFLMLIKRWRLLKAKKQAAFMFKDYSVERFAEMTGWELEVIGGVMSAECAALYADPELRVTR